MTVKKRAARVYKIQFQSQGERYELYAREVSQSNMYAFIEVAGILFGEKSKVVVDPSEERLKAEFSQVNRTYIPLHSVVRIDEVEKAGVGKIVDKPAPSGGGDAKVTPFPLPPLQPKRE